MATVHRHDQPFAETLRTRRQGVPGYQVAWDRIAPLVDRSVTELTTTLQHKSLPGNIQGQIVAHRLIGSVLNHMVNNVQHPVQNP